MNSRQLERLIEWGLEMAKSVVGVNPYNLLPRNKYRPPHGLIVNTDPHDKPCDHWVVIYLDELHKGKFFWSYGLPATFHNKTIASYYKDHAVKQVTSN